MTNRLPSALKVLGWSPGKLARHLGIAERTVRRVVHGEFPLPGAAMDWIDYLSEPVGGHPPSPELIEQRLAAQPLPDGWNQGDLPQQRRERMGHATAQAE
jgi:hypothetical protein